MLNKFDDRLYILNNKILKMKKILNEKKKKIVKTEETWTDAEKNKLQNKIKDLNKKIENIEK